MKTWAPAYDYSKRSHYTWKFTYLRWLHGIQFVQQWVSAKLDIFSTFWVTTELQGFIHEFVINPEETYISVCSNSLCSISAGRIRVLSRYSIVLECISGVSSGYGDILCIASIPWDYLRHVSRIPITTMLQLIEEWENLVYQEQIQVSRRNSKVRWMIPG